MKFDSAGWLDVAQEYNISQNSWDRLQDVPVTHLVVHGTAGGSNGNDTMAYMLSVGVSTHFAISIDGTIWQGVPCGRTAWGNAPLNQPLMNFARADLNPNYWTISVEFCKPDSTNQMAITDAQKQSGFQLIAAICEAYTIPKRAGAGQGGIIRHADINSVDKAHCPGTFPFDDLWTFLNGGNTVNVPQGWTDNGTELIGPNGVKVIQGFREFVLAHDWDPNDIPLEPAQSLSPLELGNPSLGNGVRQTFRWTLLEWTTKQGVFVGWIGQELVETRKELLAAKAQLTQSSDTSQLQAVIKDRENRLNQISQIARIPS